MAIENVNTTQSTSQPITKAAEDTLGKDDFLKLLITKLQNQDPLNPTSDEAFIADLAQFSSLEQMTNINNSISTLSVLQSNATNTTMVGYIGKTAHLSGDVVNLENHNGTVGLELPSSAKSVTINIYNEAGQLVKTIEKQQVPAGTHYFDWDGTNNNGTQLGDGKYKVKISAKDGANNALSVISRTSGKITGITYESGYPELVINGTRYSLSSIISISE